VDNHEHGTILLVTGHLTHTPSHIFAEWVQSFEQHARMPRVCDSGGPCVCHLGSRCPRSSQTRLRRWSHRCSACRSAGPRTCCPIRTPPRRTPGRQSLCIGTPGWISHRLHFAPAARGRLARSASSNISVLPPNVIDGCFLFKAHVPSHTWQRIAAHSGALHSHSQSDIAIGL
jgi:hypothetical protein